MNINKLPRTTSEVIHLTPDAGFFGRLETVIVDCGHQERGEQVHNIPDRCAFPTMLMRSLSKVKGQVLNLCDVGQNGATLSCWNVAFLLHFYWWKEEEGEGAIQLTGTGKMEAFPDLTEGGTEGRQLHFFFLLLLLSVVQVLGLGQ